MENGDNDNMSSSLEIVWARILGELKIPRGDAFDQIVAKRWTYTEFIKYQNALMDGYSADEEYPMPVASGLSKVNRSVLNTLWILSIYMQYTTMTPGDSNVSPQQSLTLLQATSTLHFVLDKTIHSDRFQFVHRQFVGQVGWYLGAIAGDIYVMKHTHQITTVQQAFAARQRLADGGFRGVSARFQLDLSRAAEYFTANPNADMSQYSTREYLRWHFEREGHAPVVVMTVSEFMAHLQNNSDA